LAVPSRGAPSTGPWLRDNWDVVPRLLGAGLLAGAALTSLALFTASFTARRAYATIGAVAVLFIGSAIGGIAEDNFTGSLSDALSLAGLPAVIVDSARWIFGDEEPGRPVSGAVSTLWLVGVTVALCALLFRRTGKQVRG